MISVKSFSDKEIKLNSVFSFASIGFSAICFKCGQAVEKLDSLSKRVDALRWCLENADEKLIAETTIAPQSREKVRKVRRLFLENCQLERQAIQDRIADLTLLFFVGVIGVTSCVLGSLPLFGVAIATSTSLICSIIDSSERLQDITIAHLDLEREFFNGSIIDPQVSDIMTLQKLGKRRANIGRGFRQSFSFKRIFHNILVPAALSLASIAGYAWYVAKKCEQKWVKVFGEKTCFLLSCKHQSPLLLGKGARYYFPLFFGLQQVYALYSTIHAGQTIESLH